MNLKQQITISTGELGYNTLGASYTLPFDNKLLNESKKLAIQFDDFENIALVGIGGSNLGTIAIHEALGSNSKKKITFFDTVDSQSTKAGYIQLQTRLAQGEKCVLIVISKSGTTTETLGLAGILYNQLLEQFPEQVKVVAITDKGSKLDLLASEQTWDTLTIPSLVGGRFSIFSPVGIFPLTLLGYNVDEIIQGARDVVMGYVGEKQKTDLVDGVNLANITNDVESRVELLHSAYQDGRNIHEYWFFSKKLESLGKWYRQLLAESIGKNQGDKGSVGIYPSTAIGSIDLHSVAQLHLAHTRKIVISLVEVVGVDGIKIPSTPFEEILPSLVGKTDAKIMNAALEGYHNALKEKGIPTTYESIRNDSCYDLGVWMQKRMLEIGLLGERFGINPFDQPNVEDYKKHMKKELG